MEKCNECNPCEETKCLGCSHYHTTECVTLEDQFGTQPTGTNLTTTLAYIWTLLQSGTSVAGDDGVGVQDATINGSGNLIITLTDGTIIDAGTVVGTDGVDGQNIDNIAFTSSSLGGVASQQGATDTYTVWGDSGQTINLGTFTIYNAVDGIDGADGVDGAVGGFTIEYNSTLFNASTHDDTNNIIQSTATAYNDAGTFEWWFSDYDSYSNDISYTIGTFYDTIVASNYDKIYIKIFDTTDSSKMQIYEATNPTIENQGDLRVDMTRLGGNNAWATSINKIGVSFSFVNNSKFEEWQPFTLMNDWTGSLEYCKNQGDLCLFKGLIAVAATSVLNNDKIGTLPVGYRPLTVLRFPVYYNYTNLNVTPSNNSNSGSTVVVNTNGDVTIDTQILSDNQGSSLILTIDLASISYRAEQ